MDHEESAADEVDEVPAGLAGDWQAAIRRLTDQRAVERMWQGDETLWGHEAAPGNGRLGWLHSPGEMGDRVGEIESFATGAAGNGLRHAVLMGMGGSSLFPEVVAETFGDGERGLSTHVLDTTDPAAVGRLADTLPLDETLFVAASKSGTTIETRSHLDFFWDAVPEPGHFVVITDPGSPLAALARDRGFRAVFENRPDIGGRYSALSHFGLVPAALVGVDLGALLEYAVDMLDACHRPEAENPGVRLGALLGVGVHHGRDKLTLRLGERIAAFGAWLEQLIAESTGKDGTGVVPVNGEPPWEPGAYGPDRLFAAIGSADVSAESALGHPAVTIPLDDPYQLGAEVVRWEVATAVAGRVLGVNPFDEPDVAAAKEATSRVIDEGLPDLPPEPLAPLLERVEPGDYLVVQAYVDPGSDEAAHLRQATFALGRRLGVPATFGLGPRYLHSTGQLHKGGAPRGVFLQVLGQDRTDVPIPGRPFGFSTLKRAQAAGDLSALRARGLRVARVEGRAIIDAAS